MNAPSNDPCGMTPVASPRDLDINRREFCKAGLLTVGAAMAPALLGSGCTSSSARSNDEIAYLSAADQLRLFRSRELSPVEVLSAQISRIEALNPRVQCITFKHFDEAMLAAKASETRYAQGNPLPLDGLTVAVKDEHDREGWVITMGSLLYANNPPASENTAIIDKLLEAGAVLHLQTTVPEFYLAGTTWTRLWGITRNPWNLQYTPGGSSGGSAAALAAGFTTLATGSDMGGSIRIPASQCGLYGFKPPFGRVPTSEVAYETSGPLARGFQDLVMMQQVISGPHPKVHSSLRPRLDYPEQFPDVRGWRVAVDYALGISELDTSVSNAMADAIALLKGLGCTVDTVDLGFRYTTDFETFVRGLLSTSTGALLVAAATQKNLLTRYVATFVDTFLGDLGPVQALAADELLNGYHRKVQAMVFRQGYQALLMPTLTTPYVPADYQIDASKDFSLSNGRPVSGQRYAATFPWNLMNRYPVVNVPIGRTPNNVPVGMQIIANTFDDLKAFQLASAYSGAAQPFYAGTVFPDFRNSV